jgi:hypothetical protein
MSERCKDSADTLAGLVEVRGAEGLGLNELAGIYARSRDKRSSPGRFSSFRKANLTRSQ